MAVRDAQDRFNAGLYLTIGICCLTTGFFWACFQDYQRAKDLLGVFGVFVTIVGFWIGLEQLAKLRTEKEIIANTKVLDNLFETRDLLADIQTGLNKTIDINFIHNGNHLLKKVKNRIIYIKVNECEYLNCDSFIETVDNIISDFTNAMKDPEAIKVFNNMLYEEKITGLMKLLISAEIKVQGN